MNNINQIENKTIQEIYEDSLALQQIEKFLKNRNSFAKQRNLIERSGETSSNSEFFHQINSLPLLSAQNLIDNLEDLK